MFLERAVVVHAEALEVERLLEEPSGAVAQAAALRRLRVERHVHLPRLVVHLGELLSLRHHLSLLLKQRLLGDNPAHHGLLFGDLILGQIRLPHDLLPGRQEASILRILAGNHLVHLPAVREHLQQRAVVVRDCHEHDIPPLVLEEAAVLVGVGHGRGDVADADGVIRRRLLPEIDLLDVLALEPLQQEHKEAEDAAGDDVRVTLVLESQVVPARTKDRPFESGGHVARVELLVGADRVEVDARADGNYDAQ